MVYYIWDLFEIPFFFFFLSLFLLVSGFCYLFRIVMSLLHID